MLVITHTEILFISHPPTPDPPPLTNPHPNDPHHNIQPLPLRRLILKAPHPILLVVPIRPARRVHAPPPSSCLTITVLNDRAVDDVLELRLSPRISRCGGGLFDQLVQDAVDDGSVPGGG